MADHLTTDEEFAAVLEIARNCNVTVHVRGKDSHVVVECRNKDRYNRSVVGGIELKRRYNAYVKRNKKLAY